MIVCREREVHDCCLKNYGVSISVICGGIIFQKRIARRLKQNTAVLMRHLVAMLWLRLFMVLIGPGGDVMLIMLFKMS